MAVSSSTYSNNHLSNFISIYSFNAQKGNLTFLYPIKTKLIIEFLDLLLRINFIYSYHFVSYTHKNNLVAGIKIFLKSNRTSHLLFSDLKPMYSRSGLKHLSFYDLKKFHKFNKGSFFILSTSFGFLTSIEVLKLNLKTGGIALCKCT